jgi:hypothetical protein
VTVPESQPLTITKPQQGDQLVSGTYRVTGTGTAGDQANVSLTGAGAVLSGPVLAEVGAYGHWHADLAIPELYGVPDLAVTATLVSGDNIAACETAVGKLAVVYPAG